MMNMYKICMCHKCVAHYVLLDCTMAAMPIELVVHIIYGDKLLVHVN